MKKMYILGFMLGAVVSLSEASAQIVEGCVNGRVVSCSDQNIGDYALGCNYQESTCEVPTSMKSTAACTSTSQCSRNMRCVNGKCMPK